MTKMIIKIRMHLQKNISILRPVYSIKRVMPCFGLVGRSESEDNKLKNSMKITKALDLQQEPKTKVKTQ